MGTCFFECCNKTTTYQNNLPTPRNQDLYPMASQINLLNSKRSSLDKHSRTNAIQSRGSTIGEDPLFGIDKSIIIGKGIGSPQEIYTFGNTLGKGAYGSVYHAIHKQTGDYRAIKIIKKANEARNHWFVRDIIREIDLLKTIDHPNIVRLFEFYEGPNEFYLVTELCKGGELFHKLKNEGGQPEMTSAIIMYQLFSSVNYCHSLKIMHRDLKPENILLEEKKKNGNIHIKLIDFGAAKLFEKAVEKQVIGTSYYIAPEVLKKNYTNKCDIWSCGVIMYVLLKGRFPFSGANSTELFSNITKAEYDLTLPPFNKISNEAKDLIRHLLLKNPNDRLTAEEALNHSWFKKLKIKEKLSELSVDSLNKLLHNIRHYHPDKVLQQAAIAYLVHNQTRLKEVHLACCLFIKIDTNNDGVIELHEFREGLMQLYAENNQTIDDDTINELFCTIDADSSNTIEYEEFVRAAIDKKVFLQDHILQFAFDYFDQDKNGVISLDEIESIFNTTKEFSKEEFQKIIDEVDINHDKVIDFSEFKLMMSKILI